jgi:hypothetical protein
LMSRKHYRAVAEVLRLALEGAPEGSRESLKGVARELADFFKRDNSLFSYQRFYEACGIETPGSQMGRR